MVYVNMIYFIKIFLVIYNEDEKKGTDISPYCAPQKGGI